MVLEILEGFLSKNNGDAKESLLDLYEVKSCLIDKDGNPDATKMISDIEDIIESEALERGLCPKCCAELDSKKFNDNYSEYLGRPVFEIRTKYTCPSCGYTED